MSCQNIVRAWRDHDYWLSLSDVDRARMPTNPAGVVDSLDAEFGRIMGGDDTCGGCASTFTSGAYCCC